MFTTTTDLIEKIKAEHSDLLEDSTENFDVFEDRDISSLIAPDWLISRYQDQEEDLKKVEFWTDRLSSGSPCPPLLIDINGNLIDGVHRYMAAQSLKIQVIPCIQYSGSLKLDQMD